jgi:antitoxin ChpS
MSTSTLRSVGGSVMMTIPKPMLDALGLSANDKVSLSVDGGRLVVERPRPVYTLAELIAQCDPSAEASDDMADWDKAEAVGREAI